VPRPATQKRVLPTLKARNEDLVERVAHRANSTKPVMVAEDRHTPSGATRRANSPAPRIRKSHGSHSQGSTAEGGWPRWGQRRHIVHVAAIRQAFAEIASFGLRCSCCAACRWVTSSTRLRCTPTRQLRSQISDSVPSSLSAKNDLVHCSDGREYHNTTFCSGTGAGHSSIRHSSK
jgi:hypothetical protein